MSAVTKEYINYGIEYTNKVEKYARKVLNKQELFGFNLVKKQFDPKNTRARSRGGMYSKGPGINIALHLTYFTYKGRPRRVYEYSSFDNDSVIGGFYTTKQFHPLEAVICHEVAHAMQKWEVHLKNIKKDKPHSDIFKKYYRILRNDIFNPTLEDQIKLKKEYNEWIARINQEHV